MIVRMIEDFGEFKKGQRYGVSVELAKDLISKGYAVIGKETTKDKQAASALNEAKARDDK